MLYKAVLENLVSKFNERLPSKPEFKEFLNAYHGRNIIIKIKKDAVYVIHISKEKGLGLAITDSATPKEDMYVEMDKAIFDNMINQRKINLQHILLGKIKWKNINLTEISKIKRIFGMHSFKDFTK